MYREADLIDVWFDSGAMPYAQHHFPFENAEAFKRSFPADFIAEGVDQTRGWFYTLHAIAGMLFDSVAYKNVVSNGLVLDKNGNKMSKRLGNAVDPFETIHKYGADPLRWYMISNGQPWDNLKFDMEGVVEAQRKLFGTLYNTYNFFAIYANVDGFVFDDKNLVPVAERPEIDRWIMSKLHSLIKEVTDAFEDYEPARAARAIEDFVTENLSNWHVRLSRRRFWDSEPTSDKKAAFESLYECLSTVSQLMSPVAPYFSDWLYQNINGTKESVHLAYLPKADTNLIDSSLEQRMEYAQEISSLVLSLRKKTKIKVRQPLQKILIPAIDPEFIGQVDRVKELVLSEVNVKEIEYIPDTSGIISKKIKPNFKILGKKLGGKMKLAADAIQQFNTEQISLLEKNGSIDLPLDGEMFNILLDEVEVISDDIQGWLVASDNRITVALDITITDPLRIEGFARELVNRVQNERKESDFQVTDKISIHVQNHPVLNEVFHIYKEYICNETLCESISFEDHLTGGKEFDINGEVLFMFIQKK
jgi:isoleucyl-tRNA synthetase